MNLAALRHDRASDCTLHTLFPRNGDFDPVDLAQTFEVWGPLINLSGGSRAPIHVRNCIEIHKLFGTSKAPWASILAVPSLRKQVLLQNGLTYKVRSPPNIDEIDTLEWRQLVEFVTNWPLLSVLSKIHVIALLNQLTLQPLLLKLVGEVSEPVCEEEEHFVYEIARARNRINSNDSTAFEVFKWLVNNAKQRVLRVSAATQLVAFLTRNHNDLTAAAIYREAGLKEVVNLPLSSEVWLNDLVTSRFFRAAALLDTRLGNRELALEDIGRAEEAHFQLVELVDSGESHHLADENRKILLESIIKAYIYADGLIGQARGEDAVLELNALEPTDPASQHVIGEFYYICSRILEAGNHFEKGGDSGCLLGAAASFKAGKCWELLGDADHALSAYRRALKLDPASLSSELAIAMLERRRFSYDAN